MQAHFIAIIYLFLFGTFKLVGQNVTFQSLLNDSSKKVIVAAHRGDWFNYPENSIPGVLSCIENGVDIVEIDVQRTRDGKYVLMHDGSVNRTTNGKGSVSSLSFNSISKLKLKDKKGNLTDYSVPSLDTILKLTKGKIVVNIDKSAGRFNELIPLIDSLECGEHVILKGSGKASYFKELYNKDSIGAYYMPILSCKKRDIDSFLMVAQPKVIEFLLNTDTTFYSRDTGLAIFQNYGCKIWYNALFNTISGGHNEAYNALDSWDWFINHNAYIIQTDYPFHLLNYLVKKGLRPTQSNFKDVDLTLLPKSQPKPIKPPAEKKEIVIEKKPQTTVEKVKEKEKVNENKTSSTKKYHIVKSGDTLNGIAKKNDLTLKKLLKLNSNLSEKSIIRKGQKIRIR
ncbi:MAG: hypothetical protein RLZ10_967 [Bacteroidota bacterium]|jgi:glycerophosphoryl diester phosphodiesterase